MSNFFFVTINDKSTAGEAVIAISIVEAVDEDAAVRMVRPTIEELAEVGRGRCVASARRVELGRVYRVGALIGGR